jgi:uncharacterized protein (DUF2164 family)
MRGKPPVVLSDDARKHAVASIRRYFHEELGQEIGDLKASFVLDYFLAELGPAVYNNATRPRRFLLSALRTLERSATTRSSCTGLRNHGGDRDAQLDCAS